jgi:short-subunit dehydrogenase
MIRGPILVTGASKGIGRAVAAALAERGVPVIGTSRDPGSISDPIPGVTYLPLRLEDDRSVDGLARAAGPVEALVNNAAQSQIAAVEEASMEAIEELFRMNLFGLIRLTKAFLPAMREQGRGAIINIGSLAGTFPPPFQSVYAATKLGLEAFTRALRQEVGPRGVKVVLVIPGDIKTSIEPRMIVARDSPYAGEVKTFRAARDKKMDAAAPPEVAAKTILRALEKKNPAPIYYTGRLASVIGFLKRVLPERLNLRLIRGAYKL